MLISVSKSRTELESTYHRLGGHCSLPVQEEQEMEVREIWDLGYMAKGYVGELTNKGFINRRGS